MSIRRRCTLPSSGYAFGLPNVRDGTCVNAR